MDMADQIPPELALDDQPFTLDELDQVLHRQQITGDPREADDVDASEVERWTITDEGSAEWAMAHYAAIQANIKALDEQAEAYVDRITRWHDSAFARLARRRDFFEGRLVAYAAEFRARDPKHNKTLHLPSGQVGSTESRPKAKVDDEAALIEWARQHLTDEQLAEVVQVTEKAMVSALRKLVTIVRRPRGYQVVLECGHDHLVPVESPDGDVRTPEQLRADGMPCDECPADPIDGFPLRRVVEVGDWDEPVVVLPVDDGPNLTVEGAGIEPATVTYKVKAS